MSKAGSLRSTIEGIQPQYTMGLIRFDLNNNATKNRPHVIVEGSDDKVFYGKFLSSGVIIYDAVKDDGSRGGWKYVLQIVKDVLLSKRTDAIIGIIDTDDTKYQRPAFIRPTNILLTDCRDLETTVVFTPHVKSYIESLNKDMVSHFNEITDVAFYLGKLQIASKLSDLGCVFDNFMKPSLIFDDKRRLNANWKAIIRSLLKKEVRREKPKKINNNINCSRTNIESFINLTDSLDKERLSDVCRGHDIIRLLSYKLQKQEYHPKLLWAKISSIYSENDFMQTCLYKDMKRYEVLWGIKLME